MRPTGSILNVARPCTHVFPEIIVVLADKAQHLHKRPELGGFREVLSTDAERFIDFRASQNEEHCGKDRLARGAGTAMEWRFDVPAVRLSERKTAWHNVIDECEPEMHIGEIFSGQRRDQVRYEPWE